MLLMTAVLMLAACADDPEPEATEPSATDEEDVEEPSDAEAADGEPITIGAINSLSGDYQVVGASQALGYELAVEHLNAAGGIDGRPVELDVLDDETAPDRAIEHFQSLVASEEVVGIIGPSLTPSTAAVAPMLQEDGIPLINQGGGYAIEPDDTWMFSTLFTTADVGRAVMASLADEGIETIVMLNADNELGHQATGLLEEAAGELGITVADSDFFPPDATDVTPQVTSLAAHEPEAIVSWCAGQHCGVLSNGVADAGLDIPVVVSHSNGSYMTLPLFEPLADGQVRIPTGPVVAADTLPDDHPGRDDILEIAEAFESMFGEPMDILHASGYDGVMQMAHCIEEVGTGRSAVRDCLESLDGWQGASGRYDRSADHRAGPGPDEIIFVTVQDGAFEVAF